MTKENDCTVLVVDDEPAITEMLRQLLESEGMLVCTAGSGHEALAILQHTVVDVVLSDIRMDGMSGFELLERIQEQENPVKVILMTAFDSYDMVKRSLILGAYDYIAKPLKDHDLIINTTRRAQAHVKLVRENKNLIARLQSSNMKVTAANKRLMQLNKQLRKLSITDGLTQLYNRRYIDDCIHNYAVTHAQGDHSFSVMLLDVDHFKQVNDSYGHDAGDEVLRHLASILRSHGRDGDIVGRYGGEEFILFLPDTDETSSIACAERLRKLVDKAEVCFGSGSTSMTVSIGVASHHTQQAEAGITETKSAFMSGRALIAQADKALYCAKDAGRNTCVHHDHIPLSQDSSKDWKQAGG